MDTSPNKRYRWLLKLHDSRVFLIILIVAIVLLGAFLRFWNLRTNPGIYGDEGMNMSVAWNLAHGKMRMFAFNFVFVTHPPLFYLIVGGLLKLLGNDILVARSVTAIYGVFTIIALYFVGKQVHSKFVGLLSSLLFAIWPFIIVNNRWALTYNQLMFFSIMTFLFSLKYVQTYARKWVYLAGLSVGLSMLTSPFGFSDLIYLVIVSLIFYRKKTWLAPCIALCLFGIFVIFMLVVAPEAFLHDLQHDFSRSGLSSVGGGILLIIDRFISFIEIGYWIPLSIVGFFLIDRGRERNLLLLIFILSSILILKTTGAWPYSFHALSLMPYLIIGLAIFSMRAIIHIWNMVFLGICRSVKWLRESSRYPLQKLGEILDQRSQETWKGIASAMMVLIFTSFIVTVSRSAFLGAVSGFKTPLDKLTILLSSDSDRVIEFVNQNIKEKDFVIASPHIGWQINGKASDIFPSLMVKGIKTPFYGIIPRHRFAFDCSYDKAKFVIMDNFWRNWGTKILVVKTMMDEIETWPIALRSGEFVIYQNPQSPVESLPRSFK